MQTKQQLLERLKNDHTYHRPHGDQAQRYEEIRARAHEYGAKLIDLCPVSRELSTALTKLEETVFHANASIARNEPQPDSPPANS